MSKKIYVEDERTKIVTGNAAYITMGLTIIVLIGIALYKYITTKNIESATEEIALFIGMSALFGLLISRKEEVTLPKTITKRALTVSMDTNGNKQRKRAYIFSAALDACAFTFLEIVAFKFVEGGLEFYGFSLDTISGIILGSIISFIILTAIFFIFEYVWGEHAVKKYNRYQENMDEDC